MDEARRPINHIAGRGLLTTHYFYLDRKPYIADRLFIDRKVRVHFRGEYVRDGLPYSLVHVWVWRGREAEMDECMDRLYSASLLKNRGDYPDACKILEELWGGTREAICLTVSVLYNNVRERT